MLTGGTYLWSFVTQILCKTLYEKGLYDPIIENENEHGQYYTKSQWNLFTTIFNAFVQDSRKQKYYGCFV